VSVLLGNGDGTFEQAVTYAVPSSESVTTGDFNGDGKLDLAVAQLLFPSGVSVLLGNGDGTFQTPMYYKDGKEDWFIAAGDFNGDGQSDLVVADNLDSLVMILLNTGVVSLTPNTPLTFPAQLIGTVSNPQTVSLTNTGKTALSISSMGVKGQFKMSSNCGPSVAPGGHCTISAAFQPTTPGGQIGTINIRDSASSKPQVIELTGIATTVSLSPTQLTFPAQKVGTKSTPQNVQLTNMGSTALNFSSIKITGKNAGDFSQTNTCGSQIGPGARCTISVSFAPTKTGTRTATLSITDDGGGSPQTVPLSGTGD
jgi:archaellum component FlaF (FlaF/FlaG flagellin family)